MTPDEELRAKARKVSDWLLGTAEKLERQATDNRFPEFSAALRSDAGNFRRMSDDLSKAIAKAEGRA